MKTKSITTCRNAIRIPHCHLAVACLTAACALTAVWQSERIGHAADEQLTACVSRSASHQRHANPGGASNHAAANQANDAGLASEVDLILALAGDPRSERAWDAVHGLVGKGHEEVEALADALAKATTPEHARLVATALAMIGSTDAVNVVWAAALAKPQSDIRSAMMEALDNLSSEDGVNLTASALVATTDSDLVAAATRVLARAATADTVDFIQEMHTDPDMPPHFRTQLEAALRLLSSPETVGALEVLAGRADLPELAAAAAEGLSKQGTGEAALALANAYANTSTEDTYYDSLRRVLAENLSHIQITPDNQAFLAMQANQSKDPALRDAARHALKLSGIGH